MTRDDRAAMVLVGGVVAAPFVAAWPLFQRHGEAMAPAFDLWSARILWATILGSLAAFIATRDHWLGAAVGLGVLDIIVRPFPAIGRSTVGIFALAALALVWVRGWSPYARRIAGHALGAVAMLEALVMLGQFSGINPLWGSWARGSSVEMTGTLGNTVFASTLVAIAGPFAPWAALPALGLLLWFAQSKIALLAFALACAVRFLPTRWAGAAAAVALVIFALGLALTVSGHARVWVWREALGGVTWLGDGLGLARAIPTPTGIGAAYDPASWRHVHSEPIQWVRERGLVGAIVLGAWLWSLRSRAAGPRCALAAASALAMIALAQPPLHVIATAVAAVLVLGLATPDPLTTGA